MTEPLFDLIDRQGNPDLPMSEKAEPVFPPQELLERLGVQLSLCREVGELATRLRPLNYLILGRKPIGDERVFLEGRGVYHTDIPISGDLTATVYVKGSGNEQAFDQPAGLFSGFPSQPDKLFFDQLAFSDHPRELGTETMRWALMEAVNATFIFAYVAKQQGWQSVSEAVAAGVTVPLNVVPQKELSAYLHGLLLQHREANLDVLDRKAMDWSGNTQLASIAMIVPNHTRIAGGLRGAEETDRLVGRLSNPNTARTAGRTLRTLADIGFCYSLSSSHGQNLYSDGLMAQADNSDLVTLGEYHGDRIRWSGSVYVDIPPKDQRIALLFHQFNRDSLLTPIHYPLINLENRITWEQVTASQEAFWTEVLLGIAKPSAIEEIVKYMPFLRTEINMAAALLLCDTLSQDEWESMARVKRDVLGGWEDDFGVLKEYDRKVKANLGGGDPYVVRQLLKDNKLRANLVAECLKSGDLTPIERDPLLGEAIRLEKAIVGITDQGVRDEILGLCSSCFSSRGRLYHYMEEADVVARFEGRHYSLLTELVLGGRCDDAKNVIKTLLISQTDEVKNFYSLTGGCEVEEDRYPRVLLEEGANYQEIYERARFDFNISSLAWKTAYIDFVASVREAINTGAIAPKPQDLYKYAEEKKLPTPLGFVRGVLGSFEGEALERRKITGWIEPYLSKLGEQEVLEDRFGEQGMAILSELDGMLADLGDRYPELNFAHNCIFAPRLAKTNPDRAEAYYQQALHYYQDVFPGRRRLIKANVDEYDDDNKLKRDQVAVARKYTVLSLPIVARAYRNRVKGKYLEAVW